MTTDEQAAAVKSALALYLRAQRATARARERAARIIGAATQHESDCLAAYRAASEKVGEVANG